MTDLRQAAQQALEALEELDGLDTETECVTIDVGDVIAALKAALEQQAEPPPEWPLIKNILAVFGLDAIAFVAKWKAAQQAELTCPECKAAVLYECVACSNNNYPPQQQAEPPPEWLLIKNILDEYGLQAIDFVAEFKAAQQVATIWKQPKQQAPFSPEVINMENFVGSGKPVVFNDLTAPPQRQWVGLTDEEIVAATDPSFPFKFNLAMIAFVRDIEAKLKERNT